eukprot:TRINITY_DN2458_c0_g1_i1.p1 TRINITY_DN2458_c0_g1~~TRINITY_DN2458_c0_g1_i1.p1  ORF type:complete len:1202 (+),score=301.91 TRINITY_DN2458_c0_g1_i1:190-3795(+)
MSYLAQKRYSNRAISSASTVRNVVDDIDGEKIVININGNDFEVPIALSIYEACHLTGNFVPALCHHPKLKPAGRCRVCVVEVEGEKELFLSCCSAIKEGMRIHTNTPKVRLAATEALRKMQNNTRHRSNESVVNNEFDALLNWGDVNQDNNGAIRIDTSLCVGCTRCVRACNDMQSMNILQMKTEIDELGERCIVGLKGGESLDDLACIACGQCASYCPVGAISVVDDIDKVYEAMSSRKVVVVQTAPAVRVTIGEELGQLPGEINTDLLVQSLRALGFNYVFDTNLTADLTIMEEATELIQRITDNIVDPKDKAAPLPLFTSCCPSWINFVEKRRPDLIPYLSTCKSPMGMLGTIIKTYWADKMNIKPENIFSVAIMPCTAKKQECKRVELSQNHMYDIDCVLTTRELGKMLRTQNIDLGKLNNFKKSFDSTLGESSGAGVIFGASGGVMEAALRTAYYFLTGEELNNVKLQQCRGYYGIRFANIPLTLKDGINIEIKVAICGGITSAQKLLKRHAIEEIGEMFHFIEVMACPGGCIGGGGQSKSLDNNILKKRSEAIYKIDEFSKIRVSHKNLEVQAIYTEWLGKPGSEKAHHALHTTYTDRSSSFTKHSTTFTGYSSEVDSDSILITYATVTGNTTGFAKSLAQKLSSGGANTVLKPMDTITAIELKKYLNVVLMTCTYGMGDIPPMGIEFYESINVLDDDVLKGVNFAVFGIGSSAYGENFNKAGAMFWDVMLSKGASPILDRGIADEKHIQGFDVAFQPFADSFMEILGVEEGIPLGIPNPQYRCVLTAPISDPRGPPPPGCTFVRMIENRRITPIDYEQDSRFITLDLHGTGIKYKTGWHVGIWPGNKKERVEMFLTWYGSDPDVTFVVEPIGATCEIEALSKPMTVRQLATFYLDFYSLAGRDYYKKLAPFATNLQEREELAFLGSKAGSDKLAEDRIMFGTNFLDVLIRYPSCRPPLHYLVEMIPLITPRLYSIASSNLMHPQCLELLIGIVSHKTKSGKIVTGLATGWLEEVEPYGGEVLVPIFIRESPLVPPLDKTKPFIACGLGTGIAPFRGFAQDKEILRVQAKPQENIGQMYLFLGCRYSNKDFLLADEWKSWEENGIITVFYAFSRENPKKKVYITDRMIENPKILFDVMENDAGSFLYCGPAGRIPSNIRTAVVKALTIYGDFDETSASNRIEEYEREGRWIFESY